MKVYASKAFRRTNCALLAYSYIPKSCTEAGFKVSGLLRSHSAFVSLAHCGDRHMNCMSWLAF